MNQQEKIDEVALRPRGAHVVFPGVQCIDRLDWHQLITPAIRRGGLNGVSLAVLRADEVEQVIDDTVATYEKLGLRFRWTVGHDSRPLDLGERLRARGLEPYSVAGMAMTYEDEVVVAKTSSIQVELVTEDTVQEFNDVMCRGWDMKSTELSDYNAHVVRTAPERNPFFLARMGGQAVGGASYFAFPKSAYLVGGVVVPDQRRQGVYKALVRARQEHAHQCGLSLTTCHAMESSAPILAKLGYETVCRFTSYVSP